ncbi:antiviral reverse transcriptase Drt3a [Larsenimonas salina]|uniref:antiviral reverse transcriptase Drt3a n=1 Tax=Larsenimonas salina TaxID=1295565 RepID=UPI002072B14B|nr:antiviral reverse transcriptase Drt3a [Larsenimonas salina]MCM5704242.1 RNA-directed DNA polymerase [Larsenimonas salina]
MHKQSFSQKNLRNVFDDENKKGRYLEGDFFPEIDQISKEVKSARQSLLYVNKKKSYYSQKTFEERKSRILAILRYRKNNRSEKINESLFKVADRINHKSFALAIKSGVVRSNKPTYCIGDKAEDFFASKQLQKNIGLAFGVKQSNRHFIIPQVISILKDDLPKIVIRTDISSFYESLNHKMLFSIINANDSLSLSSKKMLGRLLSDYSNISENFGKGVPRGVGVSAVLSEVYMANFDSEVRGLKEVVYYARYVDDIIVVFCPPVPSKKESYSESIRDALKKYHLSMNESKTRVIDLQRPESKDEFEFLGYKFNTGKNVHVDLSRRKIESYQEKLDVAFEKFLEGSRAKPEEKLLVKRIRFLTGNTKLTNNKGGAFVGIYFSNRFLNSFYGIDFLDVYLVLKIDELPKPSLIRRLKKISFNDGFHNKSFRKFTTKELSYITKVWK